MANMIKTPITLGVIVGNRGFFPRHLCETGRQSIFKALSEEGINSIALGLDDTLAGSVETLADAKKCADLFHKHRDEIDGILVTLPNFGEEKAVANSIRMADLNVPVLVHGFPDENSRLDIDNRRDAFCGKISVCNNLHQYGIPFSLTELHVVDPESNSFRDDIRQFSAICRIVRGLKKTRIGVIGARPAAFNTVRFSEKILERVGISIEPLDLSEVFGEAKRISDQDPVLKEKIQQISDYLPFDKSFSDQMKRTAKLAVVLDKWIEEKDLQAGAIQCWTSIQKNYGVTPCLLMSMMSNQLIPFGCETDVAGVIGMYSLALASTKPSAIVDWNNNMEGDPNMGILFHCSNFPKDLLVEEESEGLSLPRVDIQEIIAQTLGKENTWGAVSGRLKASPVTVCGIITDDVNGKIRVYIAEGELVDKKITTFGGYGAIRIPKFQQLLKFICNNGFEHHAAINPANVAKSVMEAFDRYLGWDIHYHENEKQE
jgi:L-fucose isomerase-like protein